MRHWRLLWTVAAVVTLSAVITSQTPSGHAVFEQALAKERVEGNLPEAIRLYERVVAEFASDRALAAQALVQVGLCYEKLGRDEAVRAYERLVRDFADQEDAVELARVRLAVLKRPAPGAQVATTMPAVRAVPVPMNALSPDGMKAALIDFDKGQNLAVYDVASQRTTLLTDFDWTRDSSYVIPGAWSPDGRRIAYGLCGNRLDAGCELRAVTLAGESNVIFRTVPTGSIWPAGWLPDGSALIVVLGRPDKTFSIGLVRTADGPFTPLRSIGWVTPYPETPSVSPDGRLIAFSDGSLGMRDIHVISLDGRTAHRITDHPSDDHVPVWSPDGRYLAFQSNRGGRVALWTVAIRDGQAADQPVRLKDGMESALPWLGWTARGLAYSQQQRTDDVYTVAVSPATGEPSGAPRLIAYQQTGRNGVPEWSPDGRYIAFVSSSSPVPAQAERRAVVVLPSGGGEPREFPFPNPTPIGNLRWFGDSRGLGFTGRDARGEPTVFRLTLTTGEWKTFAVPELRSDNNRIEWNTDGSRYFHTRQDLTGAGPAIVEHDLQSDRERIVFRGDPKQPGQFNSLRFSPDRRLLAINLYRPPTATTRQRIVVLDIETGQTPVVYNSDVGESLPLDPVTWSPTGRALLVRIRTNKGTLELRRIPIDGSEVQRIPLGAEITRLLSPGRGAPAPSLEHATWSPDGGRLAFVLRASRVESFVIESPLATVRAATASR